MLKRGGKTGKVKKRSRKAIVRELDRIFSLYIRARDGHRCVVCGSPEIPQCGHLFSRVAYSTRWDEENAFCQCAKCNINHESDAWPFISWFIEKFGRQTFDEVRARYHKPRQFKDFELEDMTREYKGKYSGVCNTEGGGQVPQPSGS